MIRLNFNRITLASPLRTLCRRVKDQFRSGAEKAKGGLDHRNNSGHGKKWANYRCTHFSLIMTLLPYWLSNYTTVQINPLVISVLYFGFLFVLWYSGFNTQ